MFWKLLPHSIREKLEAPYRRDARLAVQNVLRETRREKMRVLDVGAGDCFASRWFKNHEYIGIDIADFGSNLLGDVEKLTFKDNSFDLALCLEVLEHTSNPDQALREIYRVLDKRGFAIFSTPLLSAGYHADIQRWSPPGLRTIIENAGFKVRSIKPTGGYCRMLGLQISKISYFIKKPLKKTLWPLYYMVKIPIGLVFQILIPFILFHLDWLDKEKTETSGYVAVAVKK